MSAPAAPTPAVRPGAWMAIGIAILSLGFGIVFFFQTRDPMMLIFSVAVATVAMVIGLVLRGAGGGSMAAATPAVAIRCPACRALNAEAARFCNGCGKPL